MEREIPNYWPGNCLGCSLTNPHGLHLRFWLSVRGCATRCAIPAHLCGIDGLVHGGILTLLLEEVAQWNIIRRLARFGITREVSVRYLKPVPVMSEITAEAEFVERGERNVVIRSTIRDAQDVVLVEGKSDWLLAGSSTVAKLSAVRENDLQQFLARYAAMASPSTTD